jgi:hypothetical protein
MPAGSSSHRLRARQTASLSSRSQNTTPARLVLAETADEPNAGGIKGRKKRRAGQALVKRDNVVRRRERAGQLARASRFVTVHPVRPSLVSLRFSWM